MIEKITIVNDFTSSAFVRHPFVRVLSAFIDKIVDNKKHGNWRKLVNYSEKDRIKAFERFVTLLVENKLGNDAHIQPFWNYGKYCYLDYEVIGKMETFTNDSNYIMSKTGMKTSIEQDHISSGGSTSDLAKVYFAELPNTLIEKLHQWYKIDFEMFNYDHKDFLSK